MTVDFDPQPVYLLTCDEPLLLEDAWEDLKADLAKVVSMDFDYSRFRGGQHAADEILFALQALPIASDFRLVLVEESQALSADDQRVLAAYFDDLSEMHVLVMTASGLGARSPLLAAAKSKKFLRELSPPKRPAELVAFAEKELRKLGSSAESSALSLLVEWTEGDLLRLRGELDKLTIYSAGRKITTHDVRAAVARSSEASIFEFVDSLGEKRLSRALPLLRELISGGKEPLQILAMIVRQIRLLAGARELMDAGRGRAVESELKVPPFVGRKLRQQAAGFSSAELAEMFRAALDADKKIKSGRMAPDFALEDALFRMLRPEWS